VANKEFRWATGKWSFCSQSVLGTVRVCCLV